jgi:hypothetical protein
MLHRGQVVKRYFVRMLVGSIMSMALAFAPAVHAADSTTSPVAGTSPTAPPSISQVAPSAAYLCAKADGSGLANTGLGDAAAKVKAACTTLRTAFAGSLARYGSATSILRTQAAIAISAAKRTCAEAIAKHDTASCQAARTRALATLKQLRLYGSTAATAYLAGVRAERETFWRGIHALKGGATLPADTSVVPPAPAAGIPADAAVSAM